MSCEPTSCQSISLRDASQQGYELGAKGPESYQYQFVMLRTNLVIFKLEF